MKKIRHSILITFCLFAAFFCGVYFEKSRENLVIAKIPTPRVYLEQLKTKMNIRREGSVDIYLNGKKIEDDVVLDVKK
jgi:hypothetical protein